MQTHHPHSPARGGQKLKCLRLRSGLSTRRVSDLSKTIASQQGSSDFQISHARLAQVENDESILSIHKLFTLSAIYGVPISELLSAYVELSTLPSLHHAVSFEKTGCWDKDLVVEPTDAAVALPTRLTSQQAVRETNLIVQMVTEWAHVPGAALTRLNSTRKLRYGWIGLNDLTMYPLLRPGTTVQIDESQKEIRSSSYRTEYDRPLYFVETRTGYLCSWCEIADSHLISIPHTLSPCRVRQFAFPAEAEIIGRVTGASVNLQLSDPGACHPDQPQLMAPQALATLDTRFARRKHAPV
jgi:transcriptional regulator with XRE-family HTH domain